MIRFGFKRQPFTLIELMIVITIVAILAAFTGCSWIGSGADTDVDLYETYCDGGESLILDRIGDPRAADTLLQVANCTLLDEEVYAVAQAEVVLRACETFLRDETRPITGADAVRYAALHIESLREILGDHPQILLLSTLAPELDVPELLTQCDRELLLAHIAHQREVLALCGGEAATQ